MHNRPLRPAATFFLESASVSRTKAVRKTPWRPSAQVLVLVMPPATPFLVCVSPAKNHQFQTLAAAERLTDVAQLITLGTPTSVNATSNRLQANNHHDLAKLYFRSIEKILLKENISVFYRSRFIRQRKIAATPLRAKKTGTRWAQPGHLARKKCCRNQPADQTQKSWQLK
jgi:hypothetical protein